MRNINYIVVHCSATPAGMDAKLEDIDRWHRQQGWNGCGYHYVVELDGTIRKGRDESVVGAHCKGHNRDSIGVCYVGGLQPKPEKDGKYKYLDSRTPEQKTALRKIIQELKDRYPSASILGHRELDFTKACPCFDADWEYHNIRPKGFPNLEQLRRPK